MGRKTDWSNNQTVAFGLWRERRDELGGGVDYQRRLRKEWRDDNDKGRR